METKPTRTAAECKARARYLLRLLANELMPEHEAAPIRRELEKVEEELRRAVLSTAPTA